MARPSRITGELQLLVTSPGGVALELVDDSAVRTYGFEGVLAPEGAVVGVLNGGVPFGFDEHALPAQHAASVHADFGEAWSFHG